MTNTKFNYAVCIIYYNPDFGVIKRLEVYCKMFRSVLIIDNSDNALFDVDNEVMKFKEVVYHNMGGNYGVSSALNYAFEWALRNDIDFILTMDQDSVFFENSINTIISYIEKCYAPDIAVYAASFVKLYKDKRTGEMRPYGTVSVKSGIREVDFCITSGSFVQVDSVRQIIPLNDYFIALVDNMLCEELLRKGYRLMQIGTACFEQQVGGVVENTVFNRVFKILHHTEIRYYYRFRNARYYREKYCNTLGKLIIDYLKEIRLIFNIIVAEKDKMKKFSACRQGKRDYKKRIMGKIPDSSICW